MNWLMAPAAFIAFCIKGLCGFANTLVFSTLSGFTADYALITPVELLLGYPANAIMTWRSRRNTQIKIWLPLSLLVTAGQIPGILLLKTGDAQWLKVLFGLVIMGLALEMLFHDQRKNAEGSASHWALGCVGLCAGVLCGLYGVGALLAAYLSRVTHENNDFRGNLCLVFYIEGTVRLVLYSFLGVITTDHFFLALKLLPFMLLGLSLGLFLARRLNEQAARRWVQLLLLISGLSLFLTNLRL